MASLGALIINIWRRKICYICTPVLSPLPPRLSLPNATFIIIVLITGGRFGRVKYLPADSLRSCLPTTVQVSVFMVWPCGREPWVLDPVADPPSSARMCLASRVITKRGQREDKIQISRYFYSVCAIMGSDVQSSKKWEFFIFFFFQFSPTARTPLETGEQGR